MSGTFHEWLQLEIEIGARAGNAALLQRLIKAKGKKYDLYPMELALGTPKECFKNAYEAVEALIMGGIDDARYVEGYIWTPTAPFLIHHAWITTGGNERYDTRSYDVTIPLDRVRKFGYQYWGIEFPLDQVTEQSEKLGHFGILTGPMVVNHEFIFGLAPELEDQVRSIGE